MRKTMGFLVLAAALASPCAAQTSATVVAKFAKAPAPGAGDFVVRLEKDGAPQSVAGFAFKVTYNPAQVDLVSVTGADAGPAAGAQFTLGPAKAAGEGRATRIFTMTTLRDISAGPLADLKFQRKSGGAFVFSVDDRDSDPVDGLQDASLKNIPHTFDGAMVAGTAL